jgi:hypothetical protein
MTYGFTQSYELTAKDIIAIRKSTDISFVINGGDSNIIFSVNGKNFDDTPLKQEYAIKTDVHIYDDFVQFEDSDNYNYKDYVAYYTLYDTEYHPLRTILKEGHIIKLRWYQSNSLIGENMISQQLRIAVSKWKTDKRTGWRAYQDIYKMGIASIAYPATTNKRHMMLKNKKLIDNFDTHHGYKGHYFPAST